MRLIAAAVPAFVIAAFLAHPGVPPGLKHEALLVVLVALLHPGLGLLVVAFVAPLGELVLPILGAHPVRHAETLVVAFLAGWLVRRAFERGERPWSITGTQALSIWIFASIVVTSVAGTAMYLREVDPARLRQILGELARGYLVMDEAMGAHAAGSLLQGLGLLIAALELSRRFRSLRFWTPACLVASGIVVSGAGALLALGIGIPETLARQIAVGLPRYSAAQADVNAAGSCLLLLLGVGVGLAVDSRRTRLVWLLASIAIAGGLVLAGSRTAFVAGTLAVCGVAAARLLRSASSRATTAALVGAAAIAILFLVRAPAGMAGLGMRYGFTQASLRMIAARPVFGVGEGRYYSLSALALPPTLGWWYGRENAHDYFLQTAAELGPIGLAAFLWMIGAAVVGAARRAIFRKPPHRDGETGKREEGWGVQTGCVGGVAAYLLTCLSGHPLLVPEAAIPFWIVLGLLAGSNVGARRLTQKLRLGAAGFTAVLLATMPIRPGPPSLRLPKGMDGFSDWRTDAAGTPVRAMSDFASLFVPPDVAEIEIPLRIERPNDGPPVPLQIALPGEPGRQVLVSEEWTRATVGVPVPDPLLPRARINFAIDPTPGHAAAPHPPLYVGRPTIVSVR